MTRQQHGRSLGDFGNERIKLGSTRKRGTALILVSTLILMVFAARLVVLQVVVCCSLAYAALDQSLRTLDVPA